MATSAGGTSGATLPRDAAGVVALRISCSLPLTPSCTCRPLSSVNIVAPTAHRSVLPSTSSQRARACSGAMNAGVPITTPARVDVDRPCCASKTFAMPKSSTLSCPTFVMNRFSGFTSR